MKAKKIFLGIACGILALTILPVGIKTFEHNSNFNDIHKIENDTVQIKNQGVNLKLLSRGTTLEGYQTQTFGYSFSPENTIDKRINYSLKFIDGTSCSSVMAASIDKIAQEITLICKSDFDKEIVLEVTSSANSSVKGIVSIGYTRKIIGVEARYKEYVNYGTPFGSNFTGLINIVHSKYTHFKDNSYTVTGGEIYIDDIGDGFYDFSTDLFVDIITDLYLPYILNHLFDLRNNSRIPSGNEIMEYLDSKATSEAALLKDHLLTIYAINNDSQLGYVDYDQSFDFHCTKFSINNLNVSEVGGETFNVSDLKVSICMPYLDNLEYVVPESIEMENTNINF